MKRIKLNRIFSLFLAVFMILSLAACAGTPSESTSETDDTPDTPKTGMIAVLPQPVLTVATSKNPNLNIALDLTEEWKNAIGSDSLVQGCIVVRTEFLNAHKAEVLKFLEEYKASIDFINQNPTEASEMVVELGIYEGAATVAAKAIPSCNIVYMDGQNMKAALSGYLSTMFDFKAESVGGALPKDDFYFIDTQDSATPAEFDTELPVRISVLNGTTGFGIAKLMDDHNDGNAALNYSFAVETDASLINAGLIKGDIDIAALPTNAASTLYNKTQGDVTVLALNTLGVLYVVENGNTVTKLADLEGKTVYCPAQNPAFIFEAICKASGVNVTIDTTYAQPAALMSAIAADNNQ